MLRGRHVICVFDQSTFNARLRESWRGRWPSSDRSFGSTAPALAWSGWNRWTSRTGDILWRSTFDRSTVDSVERTVGQIGDLTLECLLGNRVHAAPRAFESAVPRRKRLTISKRPPNAEGAGTVQPFVPAGCGLGNQAGCAPVASATGVDNPRCTNGLEMHPAGDATAEPMAIP